MTIHRAHDECKSNIHECTRQDGRHELVSGPMHCVETAERAREGCSDRKEVADIMS